MTLFLKKAVRELFYKKSDAIDIDVWIRYSYRVGTLFQQHTFRRSNDGDVMDVVVMEESTSEYMDVCLSHARACLHLIGCTCWYISLRNGRDSTSILHV